jgi:serine/threonine-protein kinase
MFAQVIPSTPSPMVDPTAELREGLRDRYEFERELGRGGMATVWLARDLRHDRPVALKVLHPELAASLGPERFQREIRLAARLQHPHIVSVMDSGTAGRRDSRTEVLWFTMPYVEGESLRDRLRRERQLPVEEALRIAREAAQALQYAHQQGVIHRDIKPENLLLTRDGNTLVADFGIARALTGDGDDRLTETGLAVGTPAYMSPEQAAGEKSLDARTDVYSLAAVLYEMLAGEPPYVAATTQALIMKRLSEPPPSVRTVRPNVAESVDRAIRRALSAVTADRFGSAAEFARALEASGTTERVAAVTSGPTIARPAVPLSRRPALLLGLGFLLGLGVLFGWLRSHGGARDDGGGVKRLAVLPFDNLGLAEDEYFADGVTDEIRAKLAGVEGLQVTASRSAAEYKKSTKDLATIARELGVDYLLVGKVRWEKGGPGKSRVRVTPELIQVATGSTEWEQPFDASLTDVFQVQADVAGQVARALDVALGTPQREALAKPPTANAAAYDAYLKGEAASKRLGTVDPREMREALGHYERAVALDSGFAQAWAAVSRAGSQLYVNGTPSPELARRTREAAERALRLSPSHFRGHLALGDYYSTVPPVDWERALREYDAGLRMAPNDVDLMASSALAEISSGRWEDAVEHLTRAQALDPRSLLVGRRLAYTLIRLRRYPEAIAVCNRTLALDSTSLQMYFNKTTAYLAQGDLERARQTIRDASAAAPPEVIAPFFANFYDLNWALPDDLQKLLLQLTPDAFDDRSVWAIVLAQTYDLRGDKARARVYADSARLAFEDRLRALPDDPQNNVFHGLALAYLERKAEAIAAGEKGVALLPISSDAYNGPYFQHQLVRIYLLVGEPTKALDRLEPLLTIPYYLSPGWLRIDPTFDAIRENPRFERLLN